jgi:CheY-like chemotaxis protein
MPAILVVDDDPDMRSLVAKHLTGAGYEVSLADGAPAALESIRHRAPDLIVMDINMPDMSGNELAEALDEDASVPRMPVIYLTGLRPDAELGARTLGYPVLTKPLVAKDLLALVAQQLHLK